MQLTSRGGKADLAPKAIKAIKYLLLKAKTPPFGGAMSECRQTLLISSACDGTFPR
jgi:hypothetical protein